jgi:hypothetical protein
MEYESDAKLGSPLYNPRKTERGVIIQSLGLVTLCSGRVSKTCESTEVQSHQCCSGWETRVTGSPARKHLSRFSCEESSHQQMMVQKTADDLLFVSWSLGNNEETELLWACRHLIRVTQLFWHRLYMVLWMPSHSHHYASLTGIIIT